VAENHPIHLSKPQQKNHPNQRKLTSVFLLFCQKTPLRRFFCFYQNEERYRSSAQEASLLDKGSLSNLGNSG
ncbi:MAG: hypothetical protein PHO91_01800, partial [Patescibacteria group bacterium]|nr:hypothetical protein [Patescibacteria group bacterium]